MVPNFTHFKTAIADQFASLMAHGHLFRTSADKDALWETYLGSFPEGSNPIYRTRTVHDGSYDKSFIRAVGNVVAIDANGELVSLWDVEIPQEPAYQAVADAMAAYVKACPVDNIFLHREPVAGVDHNFEDRDGTPHRWEHFHVRLDTNRGQYYCKGLDIGPRLSEARARHDVLLRSLTEFPLDDVDAVLDLIAQNSLYRGQEHKATLDTFRKLKVEFAKLDGPAADRFAWTKSLTAPAPVARLRNTAIGTLLVDLAEGLDLEAAVRRYEATVAPANYKRPTALVTPKMVEAARKTVEELGLSLERRYARLADISVNDILFADRSARAVMKDSVFDSIATKGSKPRSLDKVEEMPIETFISEVLPRVESIEVMIENRHTNNLVSLIAPVDPNAKPLFKWDNNFSWSYNGDMADSIKERVKQAGGSVSGDLLCRLAWDYSDDLDFHMVEPGGYHIYYMNKRHRSPSGGMLDVDANGIDGPRENPVENIFYASKATMREGIYTLAVKNYSRRSDGRGFTVEIEFGGQVHTMVFDKVLRSQESIAVAEIEYRNGAFRIIKSLPLATASKEVWNVKTMEFRKVAVLTLSPNYWGERGTGNKHYFFMLDGCQNDGQARGFYNEFLRDDLSAHRKVIEIVGSKMKTEADANQLSGLGFSSTQRNDLLVRVQGAFTRTLKIVF